MAQTKVNKKPSEKDYIDCYIDDQTMFYNFLKEKHLKEYLVWLKNRYKNIPE